MTSKVEIIEANPQPTELIPKNKKESADALWDEVGFHRQLGGLWWEIGFAIFHIIIGAITGIIILPLMFPFPEIKGYYATATAVFVAIFTTFDLGTANLMNRFIGGNTTNPRKMLEYVQYFIWYQMFSGLVQVTGITLWALMLPTSDLVYLTWIFLCYSLTQYPAMTTIFKDTLGTLQQFDKAAKLNFVSADVIQASFEIFFCLFFRYTLGQNPTYGVILGVSIGLVWGKYLDDFLSMAIGMNYFSKTMAKFGISTRDCFRHDFKPKLVKETLLYGIKTGLPGAVSSYFGLIILTWWLTVPQYTTFIALYGLATSLINFIKNIKFELGGAVAESYLNGKKKLCQYYVGQMFRYNGLVQILLYSIMIVVSFVFVDVFNKFGMNPYILAIPFIYTSILRRLFTPYESLAYNIIISTNHPNFTFIVSFGSMIMNALWWYLLLVVWAIPQNYGIYSMIWLLPAGDLPLAIFWLLVQYNYIDKKIFHLKIPIWQSFGATGIAAGSITFIGYIYFNTIFIVIKEAIGLIGALIPSALLFILLPILLWMPITTFLGGWDDESIETFKKASNIAGFTKIIVKIMLKGILWARPKAKLHNKFKIDYTDAFNEAEELMIILKAKKLTE